MKFSRKTKELTDFTKLDSYEYTILVCHDKYKGHVSYEYQMRRGWKKFSFVSNTLLKDEDVLKGFNKVYKGRYR